ncbi:MAG: alpha/beta family hydrolase [Acidobacteriota bacterium]
MQAKELRFQATRSSGDVSALLVRPDDACCLLILGHGAGAGMRHAFMESICERLAERGIATFRYQFPYMEQGRKRPDHRNILLKTIRSTVAAATEAAAGLPLFAGGKSMGGRMTSMAAAKEALPGVQGLVFFGFPLHPAGKPGTERGEHLAEVDVPMLFLQGTRDKLAGLDLLRPICQGLGERATLHIVEGGDHSFHVLKRSGRTHGEVLDELADTTQDWISQRVAAKQRRR